MTSVTNGSISNVLAFSHFPTLMTNGVALPVCVTDILIYWLIEPFPAFLVKLICIRAFDDHFTIRNCMPTRSLIKRNRYIVRGGGGGGGGGVGGGRAFCEGETESASRTRPPGQSPLADSVRGDTFWGPGTKSAPIPTVVCLTP